MRPKADNPRRTLYNANIYLSGPLQNPPDTGSNEQDGEAYGAWRYKII
jgi:hypothetical protein